MSQLALLFSVAALILLAGCSSTPVSCSSSRECGGLVCDVARSECVECLRDVDCFGAGEACIARACTIPTPCTSSRQCPGQVCDAAAGFCVECLTEVDCPASQVCEANACTAPAMRCDADAMCADRGLVCDEGRQQCVACIVSADCAPSEICRDNVCEPPVAVDAGVPTDAGMVSTGSCGEAIHGGAPLAIPDGQGVSYETTLDISGFSEGQTLDDLNTFIGTCVTMEHSWLRDLQIELTCPSGQTAVLSGFLGRNGGEVYVGMPDDTDGTVPRAGTGSRYCWTTATTQPTMLDYADAHQGGPLAMRYTLPPGDYQAFDRYAPLAGCQLNGTWTFRATDDWASDNGFVFEWSVEFDPSIIPDCDTFRF